MIYLKILNKHISEQFSEFIYTKNIVATTTQIFNFKSGTNVIQI